MKVRTISRIIKSLRTLRYYERVLPFPNVHVGRLRSVMTESMRLVPVRRGENSKVALCETLSSGFRILNTVSLSEMENGGPRRVSSICVTEMIVTILLRRLKRPNSNFIIFFIVLVRIYYHRGRSSSLLIFRSFFSILIVTVSACSFRVTVNLM